MDQLVEAFEKQPPAQKERWCEDNMAYYRRLAQDDNVSEKEKLELTTLVGGLYMLFALKKPSQSASADATKETARRFEIDEGIKDEELHHSFDYMQFEREIHNLFQWHDSDEVRDKYLAPYFAMVQSSGMGKTKLMFEYTIRKKPKNISARLLLCTMGNGGSGVHKNLTLPKSTEATVENRQALIQQLENIVENEQCNQLVLLVDEAQHLVQNEGFLFRCFRNWLRLDRKDRKKIVAIFAGTTSRLTNFYVERPTTAFSRNAPSEYYENKGKQLYSPFFHFSTIGAGKNDDPRPADNTDFRRSIKYGRPLFHVLQKYDKLDTNALDAIQKRLLLTHHPENNKVSWLSVLSVRVQMGRVSLDIASSLISLGYANLTHFHAFPPTLSTETNNHATIVQQCHFPDPVLARSAMQLMNKNREEWSKHAMDLFSSGICSPEKGDTGEVFAALFMLFCGDELREKQEGLEQFSVPLKGWLDKMGASLVSGNEDSTDNKFVSFIQVCRNYVRLDPGQIAAKENFLKELYESGSAMYAYSGATASDLLVPIKLDPSGQQSSPTGAPSGQQSTTRKGKKKQKLIGQDSSGPEVLGVAGNLNAPTQQPTVSYEGMLISVKNRIKFTITQMVECLGSMVKQLELAGVKKGTCLLLLLGMDDETLEKMETHLRRHNTRSGGSGDSAALISCYVVIVSKDAHYGIGNAIQCTTSPGGERAEMYASHFSLSQLAERGQEAELLRKSLRTKGDDEDLDYTKELATALQKKPGEDMESS
eukprot:CAMPEP_0168740126 /NCGR_PEP_ID=MMETSP0724-20121128/11816_1 /TAXON_ID=265536 /ORGANISM="Amphiprora sp., Strain CCMP467" /LENGTH=762 /DNA_ID=CAMNT_0008787547 /DNA_START=299 /DNA_END=2587 /DNA_ORIENTATION=-